MAPSNARLSGQLVVGLLCVAFGSWLGLERLGVDLPGLEQLWPVFPILGGLAFLLAFATGRRRDPGVVWPGSFGVLVGLFFALFTSGAVGWDQMPMLWPVFPILAGLSFVATWLAGGARTPGLLVPAVLLLGAGGLALALTLRLFDTWLLPAVDRFWPLLLILFGAYLVWRSLTMPRPT